MCVVGQGRGLCGAVCERLDQDDAEVKGIEEHVDDDAWEER